MSLCVGGTGFGKEEMSLLGLSNHCPVEFRLWGDMKNVDGAGLGMQREVGSGSRLGKCRGILVGFLVL